MLLFNYTKYLALENIQPRNYYFRSDDRKYCSYRSMFRELCVRFRLVFRKLCFSLSIKTPDTDLQPRLWCKSVISGEHEHIYYILQEYISWTLRGFCDIYPVNLSLTAELFLQGSTSKQYCDGNLFLNFSETPQFKLFSFWNVWSQRTQTKRLNSSEILLLKFFQ